MLSHSLTQAVNYAIKFPWNFDILQFLCIPISYSYIIIVIFIVFLSFANL